MLQVIKNWKVGRPGNEAMPLVKNSLENGGKEPGHLFYYTLGVVQTLGPSFLFLGEHAHFVTGIQMLYYPTNRILVHNSADPSLFCGS